MHMFDQVTVQLATKQVALLLDEGTSGRIGQVFDRLAAQNGQFAPP